ncbi:hypothetical protein E5288_WYG019971 [Bos mutus]|uniref:Uncharacterized protein n=1 Tax=Bos mutus TaxID=72004 RepID=A0A6B0RJA3_9CETA|nr:hypothetical protein [Bos mutus]
MSVCCRRHCFTALAEKTCVWILDWTYHPIPISNREKKKPIMTWEHPEAETTNTDKHTHPNHKQDLHFSIRKLKPMFVSCTFSIEMEEAKAADERDLASCRR